ncbi:DNA recombination protein RmuC [Hyphomicrobium sp.]|uniref:DNA recombination protein RmuC n=1 Tax=Hyphomicrobium sp. TaxID=82 RepID=UPI002E358067|nr:DNA recombination protein RmuC [Hyphomicrobium sp.]HEX2841282.1 DNA recombination protein RmuC [Hyphomicrobium sp.]
MIEQAPDRLSQWLAAPREALSAAVSGLDPLLVAAVVGFLVLLPLIALGLRSKSGTRDREAAAAAEFAEIKGRLTAMSEMTVRRQSEEARALDERVEQVSARLNTALDGVSRRLSESLSETQRQSGDTVARLAERVDTLARHMSASLDTVSTRLGDNLAEAGRRTTESLSNLNERLAVIAEAKQSLADLSTEVTSLSGVLANKQARGAFGQVRMEAIIRDALPAGTYEFQPTLSNGKRPDCVIRLPNTPAALVVDSKFPLEGFEALRTARASDEVKAARDAIRTAVGHHIDDIAEKYLIPGETQDTALMFVPSESVYGDLHEHFADLVQRAHRSRVVIVAPNILMLAVQTVQAVIKDAKMRDQAGLIQREVGLLLGEVTRLVEHVTDLERHFGLSGKALQKVQTSASRIGVRGERLTALDLEDETAPQGAPAAAQLTSRAS